MSLCLFVPTKKPTNLGKCSYGTAGRRDLAVLLFLFYEFTAFQLKVIQEVITLCVFVVFAWSYLGESVKWNHAVSFLFLLETVAFAFWGKP